MHLKLKRKEKVSRNYFPLKFEQQENPLSTFSLQAGCVIRERKVKRVELRHAGRSERRQLKPHSRLNMNKKHVKANL